MSKNSADLIQNFADFLMRLVKSPAFKFIIVGFLLLALTIPLLFVYSLNYERKRYANNTVEDVGNSWGRNQDVRGPYLIVPTIKRKQVKVDVYKDGEKKTETKIQTMKRLAVFLPEELKVQANIKTEIRKRGIFSVPVYQGNLDISGKFLKPDTSKIARDVDEIIWDEAIIALIIKDVNAIKKNVSLKINNGASIPFRSGLQHSHSLYIRGIHVPLTATQSQEPFNFSMKMRLNGSKELYFVPIGHKTQSTIKSDWPHPSFQGTFLPDTRKISPEGFEANWNIPRIATGQSKAFLATQIVQFMGQTKFGINFYQPSGYYSLIERSLKYAIGFIAIVFFAVFIIEVQSNRKVHWIQYIFVGLAQILFYLVLLGISEHAGFELAYGISSVATAILIATYVGMAMQSVIKGLSIFLVLSFIYGLLYMLLRMEDYAMLIGSIAAFALLTIVMFATRNVDWAGPQKEEKSEIV